MTGRPTSRSTDALRALLGLALLVSSANAQVQANSAEATLLVDERAGDGFHRTRTFEWIPGSVLDVELFGGPLQPVALLIGDALSSGISFGASGVLNVESPVALFNGFDPAGFPFMTSPGGSFGLAFGSWLPLGTEFALQGVLGSAGGVHLSAPQRIRSAPARMVIRFVELFGSNLFGSAPVSLTPGFTPSNFVTEYAIAPDGLRLAYVWRDRNGHVLSTVDPVGKEANQHVEIVRSPASQSEVRNLAWDPSGQHLAFVFRDTAESLLCVTDRYGSSLIKVPGIDVDDLAWSPDGQSLAFRTELFSAFSPPELFIVRFDGTGLESLTAGLPVQPTFPPDYAWSPDGTRLAIRIGNSELFTVLPDGSSPVPLASGVSAYAWAPDGRRIAYISGFPSFPVSARSLWSVEPDGNDPVQLSSSSLPHVVAVNGFTWSPAGTRIAYLSNELGPSTKQLFVVAADDEGTRARASAFLQGSMSVDDFTWSPDGQRLAMTTRTFPGLPRLYTTDLETRSGRLLGELSTATNPPTYRWSPRVDEPRIAFVADEDFSTPGAELYVMHPDGFGKGRFADVVSGNDWQWDPTGRWLAFRGRVGSTSGLLARSEESEAPILLTTTSVTDFRWSPAQPPIVTPPRRLVSEAVAPSRAP